MSHHILEPSEKPLIFSQYRQYNPTSVSLLHGASSGEVDRSQVKSPVTVNKIFWGIALAFLCWASCSINNLTIQRFLEKPTFLTKLDYTNDRTGFPSVTICPEVTFPDDKIDDFLEYINYPSNLSTSILKPIIHELAAFYSPDVVYSIRNLRTIEFVLDFNNIDVMTAVNFLTLSCEELLLRCRYYGEMKNCSELFELELTKFGFCCIFNARSINDDRVGGQNLYAPRFVLDKLDEFIVVVNASQDQTDLDLTYNWMYLQSSQSYIESGVNGTPIAPNTEVWVGFYDTQFLIDDDVKEFSAKLDLCRPSTDKLKYFQMYSKSYCLVECEIEQTLRKCHCARLTHPGPPNVPYCRSDALECAKDAAVWYNTPECSCASTCDLTSESFVSEVIPLMPGNYIHDHFYDDLDFTKVTIVRAFVSYRANKVFSRSAHFTSEDLFSQIGGGINVFFGCSILTILEILQLFWHCYKDYRNRTSSKQNTKLTLLSLNPKKKNKKKTKAKQEIKTRAVKGKVVPLQKWLD